MMTKNCFVYLLVIVLFTLIVTPQNALSSDESFFTLQESIQEAIDRNWDIKAKKEKIEQAGHGKAQARADFLPKLSMRYGYKRLDDIQRSEAITLGPGMTIPGEQLNTKDNYQMKFSASQPIFTGFALISSYNLAKLGVDISELELELEKLDLALAVKEAYFGILKADKAVDVALSAVESLESNLKVARNFYEVGMSPINDVLKAEVELAHARQNLVKARNESKLARSSFNRLLARPTNSPVEVKDIVTYDPGGFRGFNAYLKRALKTRPEVKAVDVNIERAEEQARLARSEAYPEVSISYNYIKEGDDPGVSGSQFHEANRWEIVAGAEWTFWEWGKTYHSVKEKEALKRELIRTKKSLVDRVRLQVKEALLSLEEAEKRIPVTVKGVEQARENLRVNEARYKAQVSTITEVLDAQALLTRARTDYYTALYDHHLARARLKRAIGTY